MTPSKIFFLFCLSFIGGIFLNSFFQISQLIMLGILILGLILISVFWQYKKLVVVGFSILFLVLGIWRHQTEELRFMSNDLRKINDSGEKVTVIGIVSEEPDVKENNVKLTIQPEKIKGKVLITTRKYPEYQYGDKVKITGQLENPSEDIDGFNYKNYLKKDGIISLMNFPEIELLGSNFGFPLMKILFSFKDKFQSVCRSFISPPQEGILEALIFGEENNIPKGLKNKLNITGTRHITAVSGMNITILSALILNFLLFLGFWRNQAFYLSIFLLILYILMIGAPASGVRAGIMAILFLIAQHFGRLSSSGRAVFFAAALMLAQNPFLLRLDVGFQLSFLAILGIIYLQSFFSNWFSKIPNPRGFSLRVTLSATISAQVFTLPILVYNFGYVPLLSPIINILIVPFLAPFTILIFIFGLSAILFYPLGFLLSWIVWFCLNYIVKVIDWFSQIPWVSLSFKNISWLWLVISYLILVFFTWYLNKRQKLKFLQY